VSETRNSYTPEENAVIRDVTNGLRTVDHTSDQALLERFENIVLLLESTRDLIGGVLDNGALKEVRIEIDLSQKEPELQLYITEKPARHGIKLLQKHFPGKTKTKILVLTKSGYRPANPENLDSGRFRHPDVPILKQVKFKPRSYSSIDSFLEEFQYLLHRAQEE
jgi:hypothetical protein